MGVMAYTRLDSALEGGGSLESRQQQAPEMVYSHTCSEHLGFGRNSLHFLFQQAP